MCLRCNAAHPYIPISTAVSPRPTPTWRSSARRVHDHACRSDGLGSAFDKLHFGHNARQPPPGTGRRGRSILKNRVQCIVISMPARGDAYTTIRFTSSDSGRVAAPPNTNRVAVRGGVRWTENEHPVPVGARVC